MSNFTWEPYSRYFLNGAFRFQYIKTGLILPNNSFTSFEFEDWDEPRFLNKSRGPWLLAKSPSSRDSIYYCSVKTDVCLIARPLKDITREEKHELETLIEEKSIPFQLEYLNGEHPKFMQDITALEYLLSRGLYPLDNNHFKTKKLKTFKKMEIILIVLGVIGFILTIVFFIDLDGYSFSAAKDLLVWACIFLISLAGVWALWLYFTDPPSVEYYKIYTTESNAGVRLQYYNYRGEIISITPIYREEDMVIEYRYPRAGSLSSITTKIKASTHLDSTQIIK